MLDYGCVKIDNFELDRTNTGLCGRLSSVLLTACLLTVSNLVLYVILYQCLALGCNLRFSSKQMEPGENVLQFRSSFF